MTYAAGRMVLTFFFCCALTTVVNAQTAETESSMDKYLRLSKEADENPTNWQAQLEMGHMLLDKESSLYNQSRAAKYYERIYQQVAGFNKEVPDSVFRESVVMLMTVASDKKDLKKALFYTDELMRAEKIGMDINKDYVITCGMMGIVLNLINGDAAKALCHMLDMRKLATAELFNVLGFSLGKGTLLYGLVYDYLPFMIYPIYNVLLKMDNSYAEAAADLGATPVQVFGKVTLPLSMPGISSGILMVFMPTVSTVPSSRRTSIHRCGTMVRPCRSSCSSS